MCLATALDKAFENIDCMIAILCCEAKNRFYETTQRLIQPRRVLWIIAYSFIATRLSVSLIMERNADVCRADQLLLFVIFFVFLELCLFFAKQFLEHPAPLKIGRVFDHCPIVRNVLLYDKTLHEPMTLSKGATSNVGP
jgi:hypothetical protein